MLSLAEFNALDLQSAVDHLRCCCGSERWARDLARRRPFDSVAAIAERADAIWGRLGAEDWLEAFAAHPRIGESAAGRSAAESARWSSEEQADVQVAAKSVLARLAKANRDYEERFGFIFIVCATGKRAEEMLAIVEGRLARSRDEELKTAAEEQRKITRLRLEKSIT
ncbi:MAG: OHCU decarboxylase [Blastocatellia bacterium]|nr:MAG: OHCU decarboxylase [Blastocatellia bacterium]